MRGKRCLCTARLHASVFFWVVSLIVSAAAPLQQAPAVTGRGELEKAWGNEVRVVEGDLLSALPLVLSLAIQAR